MLPSDRELLRALMQGQLTEDQWAAVDALLERSEEARAIVANWKDLDIPKVKDLGAVTDSQLLDDAIQAMRSEIAQLQSGCDVALGAKPPGPAAETNSGESDRGMTDLDESSWIGRIAGIQVGKVLGRGAMGIVYEGFDETLGRRVAIKVPSRERIQNPETQKRFLREAQSAAQLAHENIVAIHSIQTIDGIPILIQQFVNGETLQAKVDRDGPLKPAELIAFANQIGRGLTAAHALGIVHRDLKPENLILEHETNVARIADFGLAKRESSTLLTHRNVIAGTPAFMSPEQTLGKKLDAQCDLFSFGSVLRYAATGEAPFGKDDVDVVFHRIRTLNLEPLSKLRTDLDSSVCVAFDRLLIKDKSQRTESANRFLEEISGQDPVLKKKALTPLAWSVGLGIVCVVALGVGIGMFFLRSDPSRQPADGSVSSATSPLSRDFPFHIQGTDYRFQSLAEAIQMAKSGQEIVVSSDGPFACSQIAIGRKRISVVAGEGAHPKFTNSEDGFGRQFLITSSDLRLRGLEIDWLVDVELMDLQTMRELPAILCEDGKLELESCTVRRGMMGASVYGGRGMSIRDCLIEGGSHGISWLASGHELVVDNSTIRTKNGILVMFPPVASQPKDSGQCQLTNVRFECELAVEVALLRVQSKPISFESKGCTFDNPYLVGIMGAPPLARQIAKPVGMILMMRSSLVWNEENCVHQLEQMCVSSRLLKQTTQRNHGDVVGLSAWKREWNSDFAGSSESPRTETN